jgi:glycosyltransferase involved in cell wall biosynthesis
MKVSIITVVYNGKNTIEDCLKSIYSQTYPEIEHIVVDGGSADGTVDIIKRNKKSISKWISEPDKGIYDALNKGIKMATGDIIGFLHADDVDKINYELN